jgi:hypothetical protein
VVLGVYVANPDGMLTADEHARIDDAIATLDQTWTGSAGIDLVEVSDPSQATIIVSNSTTSPAGGLAAGVLGSTSLTFAPAASGELDEGVAYLQFSGQAIVNLIEGWNWYAGSDPTQIGAGQYDYQSVVAHELGHSVGLYHNVSTYGSLNNDGHSAMYPVLNPGDIHRQLSPYDISWLNHLYANGDNPGGNEGPESVAALMASPLSAPGSLQTTVNEPSLTGTLSPMDFRSLRDQGSSQPENGTEAAGTGNVWSPASASFSGSQLPLETPGAVVARNGRTHVPMPNSADQAVGEAWASTTPGFRNALYISLSDSAANSLTDSGEEKLSPNRVLTPSKTSDGAASLPGGDIWDSKDKSNDFSSIWNCDSNQFSAEDQLAGSICDTLFPSCDILDNSVGAPLVALALMGTLLPGLKDAEIGRKRPTLRV